MPLNTDTKIIGGAVIATILIIVGAVFFFSKPPSPSSKTAQKIDSSKLSSLIRDDSDQLGSPSAKATLVEFGDFQCPACGTYHPIVKQLITEMKADMRFVFRNFPLDQHKNARIAAYAAEAAGKQGKYWEMYDMIYENQDKWSDTNKARDIFIGYAQTLQLDKDKFQKDLDAVDIKDKVTKDQQDGFTLAINSTPTFFLNGEKISNPQSYDDFKTLIKAAILKSPISQVPKESAFHIHANFKVYLNGNPLDFSLAKYQSPESKELDEFIHLHDGVGDLIHIHKKGETLGDLFKSLKITFNKDCLILDTGEKYCTAQSVKGPRLFINGKPNDKFDKYIPQDLDRILITYGSTDQLVKKEITSVSDTACIYSKKCPERGNPPTEHCVGGLGSDCDLESSPTPPK